MRHSEPRKSLEREARLPDAQTTQTVTTTAVLSGKAPTGPALARSGIPARFLILAALATGLSSEAVVRADILTDPSQLNGANTLIDFESLSVGTVSNPLILAGATFSGLGTLEVSSSLPWSPPPVVYGNVLLSYNTSQYLDMRIDFDSPVSEIGFGMWDPNFAGNYLRVYDAGDTLLESVEFPVGAPGGSFAAFRGIRRSSDEISYAILDISSGSEFYGIDNVSFGAHAIPEPGGIGAVLAVATAGLMTRRKRQ